MNNLLKNYTAMIALCTAALIAGCNNDTRKEAATAGTTTAGVEHQHTWACPMHPEVTGKEGDSCPKCGMKLEHNDNAGSGSGKAYFMQFRTQPATVEANKDVVLSLIPKVKGSESEAVALDVEHEKKIHLILVSEDLSWFDHIHPEYNADGSYQVTARFPAGGKYKLFADYKPAGGNHVVDKIDVTVGGNAPAARNYTAEQLTGNVGEGYTVTLTPAGGKFITGAPMHIAASLQQNGRTVDPATLENYLGAKAHVVVISRNEMEYLHVHPNVADGKFDLHTTFGRPGIYRGWLQFQSGGKVRTADFVINVQQGTEADRQRASAGHNGGHEGHSGH
jgi:hypothetical protein